MLNILLERDLLEIEPFFILLATTMSCLSRRLVILSMLFMSVGKSASVKSIILPDEAKNALVMALPLPSLLSECRCIILFSSAMAFRILSVPSVLPSSATIISWERKLFPRKSSRISIFCLMNPASLHAGMRTLMSFMVSN
jgi:hypothetical protein